jgi:hypothetical protein
MSASLHVSALQALVAVEHAPVSCGVGQAPIVPHQVFGQLVDHETNVTTACPQQGLERLIERRLWPILSSVSLHCFTFRQGGAWLVQEPEIYDGKPYGKPMTKSVVQSVTNAVASAQAVTRCP